MIDYFTVLNKRGYVLYAQHFAKLKVNAIDALVRDVLLEERGGDNSYTIDNYTLKWTFANEYELIFVVIYQKILSLVYIEDLLSEAKKAFCEEFKALNCNANSLISIPFEDKFTTILNDVETTAKKRSVVQKKFSETEKGKTVTPSNIVQVPDSHKPRPNKDKPSPKQVDEETPEQRVDRKRREFAERMARGGKKPAKPVPEPQPYAPQTPNTHSIEKMPPKRNPREWDDVISRNDAAKLDRSSTKPESNDSSEPIADVPLVPLEKINLSDSEPESDEEQDSELDEEETREIPQKSAKPTAAVGFLKTYFGGLTGNKVLSTEDLEPVLLKFKQHLMEKNVASDIADKLCQSVSASLEGKKLSTFQGISSTVKSSLEEALTRILTPKRQIDILREVAAVKGKRPYSITFCGVNGVGKSTNLAKVTSWLMQNGLTVMLAACDTFRAGAVEQLGHHAKKLGVRLYERGYGKDAAGIAMDAISYAKEEKIDVVLIDTAGRMQHNEPLMRSLAKLVNNNKVDLVLFVGEALVGNDGVDQLVTFNKALADLSTSTPPRVVDGIILTKFDTIDDKVGAAISMVYTTGQPIVFIGTGQHYTDLKKMNVSTVVKTLLK